MARIADFVNLTKEIASQAQQAIDPNRVLDMALARKEQSYFVEVSDAIGQKLSILNNALVKGTWQGKPLNYEGRAKIEALRYGLLRDASESTRKTLQAIVAKATKALEKSATAGKAESVGLKVSESATLPTGGKTKRQEGKVALAYKIVYESRDVADTRDIEADLDAMIDDQETA